MTGTAHPDSIVYDLPYNPTNHPADVLMNRIEVEARMKAIREMDINEWVREQQ